MCDYLIYHQIHLPKDIYYVPVHSTLQNHVLEHPMVHIWDIFVSKMNKNYNTDTYVSQNGPKYQSWQRLPTPYQWSILQVSKFVVSAPSGAQNWDISGVP